MRLSSILALVAALSLAGTAQAETKLYSSDRNNGNPGDSLLSATNLCPPLQMTARELFGFDEITDDGLGTVTLEQHSTQINNFIDLGPDELTLTFGPGAFVFINNQSTRTITAPHISNTTGIGGHGPSATAPGATAEWGVVSGWAITGLRFCLSSPIGICNENGFAHGASISPTIESQTYDLGTWNFDTAGDYEAAQFLIFRTSNGGLSNNQQLFRGAFHGVSLPALPFVGFGALALGLVVIGGRAVLGKK
jgi:hypothetical protein